ncbi:hypothetical protein SOM08_06250 [Hydrogenophaga sp. SNF1]|uniref:hypothetical protein n=1 Tax=Hydrogenophaga sp. SNF1 TaxID=3098762 RepID=UPI002ACBFDA9|nr:hypothetical protein [Hydrogenophaga sp. SNF1]WQB84913.1 hypothetical protein SOM08_06250 [Hydrogenophaga sp. SNF1]
MTEPVTTTAAAALAATTTATTAAAGMTAAMLGADPLPWAIGAAGAAIAFLLRAPSGAKAAIANGAISVLFGGLGAPFAARVIAHQFGDVYANDLVLAAVLSIAWPWLVPIVWGWFRKSADAMPVPKSGGQ